MRRYGFLTLFFLFCLCLSATEKKDFEKAVHVAVSRQMQKYPKSTLKDLYKNFFQDKFGPGHIIGDTASAGNYLRRELASYTECTGDIAEPTGWEGNFLRVNLSVIKNGQIPYATFFDAFVRSVFAADASRVQDILIHRDRADFRRAFQTGKEFGDGTAAVFRDASLEYMGQDDLVGQKPAAGSIQRLFFLPRAQILGNSGRGFHGITIFL